MNLRHVQNIIIKFLPLLEIYFSSVQLNTILIQLFLTFIIEKLDLSIS